MLHDITEEITAATSEVASTLLVFPVMAALNILSHDHHCLVLLPSS